MPRYHKLGDIPSKRHTVFKNKNGDFYYEELFGTIGFDGMSLLCIILKDQPRLKKF